jgi:hypothetical protein
MRAFMTGKTDIADLPRLPGRWCRFDRTSGPEYQFVIVIAVDFVERPDINHLHFQSTKA